MAREDTGLGRILDLIRGGLDEPAPDPAPPRRAPIGEDDDAPTEVTLGAPVPHGRATTQVGPRPPSRVDLREFAPTATSELDTAPGLPLEPLVPVLITAAQGVLASTTAAFPPFTNDVLEAVARPGIDVGELARLIGRDALVATQVLRVANSALYARGNRVTELKEAIARLGLKEVAGIAAVASMQAMVNPSARQAFADYPQVWKALWLHSMTTSHAAGWLAGRLVNVKGPLAFMGGLIQPVGKMFGIQALALANRAQRIPRLPAPQVHRLLDLASLAIGDHVAQVCRYPDALASIFHDCHGAPAEGPFRREAQVVTLVACMAQVVGGAPQSAEQLALASDAAVALGLDRAALRELAERSRDARSKAHAILDLVR